MEVFAIDILEEAREDILAQQSQELLSDFNKKSDLLFVYFPDAVSILPRIRMAEPSGDHSDFMTSELHLYRKDGLRIRRLEDMIRGEVLEMQAQQRLSEGGCTLSETASLAWIWLATFQSRDNDPSDNYLITIIQLCIWQI